MGHLLRIGGARNFFLEAKKPSIDIRHDTHPVFQLRRYAWSAKLPLSILSDFEEFAVYDSRIKPKNSDTAATDCQIDQSAYQLYKLTHEEIKIVEESTR